jgi:predicted hotdog family 3-hydroxylacyl-ACP dehydratase
MRLLEWVTSALQNGLQAETVVTDSWPLKRDGAVDSILCVELVAQAISAFSTWRRGEGAEPRLGLLVGIKEAELFAASLPLGLSLTVQVEKLYHVGDYAVFRGQVKSSLTVLCTAVIQVMEPSEDQLAGLTPLPATTLGEKKNED